jgi:hypothetical protein
MKSVNGASQCRDWYTKTLGSPVLATDFPATFA